MTIFDARRDCNKVLKYYINFYFKLINALSVRSVVIPLH